MNVPNYASAQCIGLLVIAVIETEVAENFPQVAARNIADVDYAQT